MLTKQSFKKITDYIWEIPKSYRPDMRVPARFYISEKMIEKILEDETVIQAINLATLPGIQKYSLVMPDAHSGYGSPIGGVAAFDIKKGIISPGMTGYDINCLTGDSRVQLENGVYLLIKDLEGKYQSRMIKFVDLNGFSLKKSAIIYFLKRKEKNILEITTETNYKIKVTKDHPFYTFTGMKEAKNLKINDKIAIYPFEGVLYEEPSKEIIFNEKGIRNILLRLHKTSKGNSKEQIINFLKKRGLLELRYNSKQIPYLLKIIGYVLGDGTISFINGKKGSVGFYGKKEDLRNIRKDIQKIGFKPSNIYSRLRHHKIKTNYGTYEFNYQEQSFKVGGCAFAVLLMALGLKPGSKTHQEYLISKWILKSPLWHKRLFLASFFGAEFASPATINGYNFYAPQLNMNKDVKLKKNGQLFLKQVINLLNEFGIKCSKIVEVNGNKYKGKKSNTCQLRFSIPSNPENLIKLFSKVGYEYNREKQKKACLAISYLNLKSNIIDLREKTRKRTRQMFKNGAYCNIIFKKFENIYTPRQFIEHSIWCKGRVNPRIAFNFSTFEDFEREFTEGNFGLFWDKIKTIKELKYNNWVYDLTIKNKNHNFIANNFVVSNCGVRFLRSNLEKEEIRPYLNDLANQIQRDVPSGLGRGTKEKLSNDEIEEVLNKGAKWAIARGYGKKEDLEVIEEGGCYDAADAQYVSEHACKRGQDQVGTLGSGNHFIELQYIDEIFDAKVAEIFGLFLNQIVVLIHTGSRGLGHQVATDYIRAMMPVMQKYKIVVPDRELACTPFNSEEGQKYFAAMAAAANFAWANRQMITFRVREAFERILAGKLKSDLEIVYDVAHNIVKIEEYNGQKLVVHRKGATRAFGPEHQDVPEKYREVGQPVLIPGSMGTASYVLVGTKQAERETFGSTCHGSGRIMSRKRAKQIFGGRNLKQELEKQGIIIRCASVQGLLEEAPLAYKDVEEVVGVVHQAGISKKVARLKPLVVIKGE